jgi:hypothetical protein
MKALKLNASQIDALIHALEFVESPETVTAIGKDKLEVLRRIRATLEDLEAQ